MKKKCLNYHYLDTNILITSRPDDIFSSWEEFQILTIAPFTKEKSIGLIEKIDYDETVKNKFIAHLNKDLFKKHESFLSNPLLITIMLLTYDQLAEIPNKLHIFYEQAFDTLNGRQSYTRKDY